MDKIKIFFSKIKEELIKFTNELKELRKSNFKSFFKRRKYIFLAVVIMFLGIGFYIGSSISSEDTLIKNLEVALKQGKSYKISGNVKMEGKKIKISELQPLIKYYKGDSSKVDNIIKDLRSNGNSKLFSIKEGKKFFEKSYYLELHPVSIKVETNFKEAKIYLENELLQGARVKTNLVPGVYSIRGELSTPYGDVKNEKEVYLMQNENVTLDLNAINISLSSKFQDADVFINEKNTGKKVKDIVNYGPIPKDKNINIFIEKEFPWGKIKGEEVLVTDIPNINLNINMVNDKLISDINNTTKNFYESVFEALNKRDYNLIGLTKEETKEKIYDGIERKSFLFKNNYELSELNTEIESSEFEFENNKYTAKIVTKINYSIYKKLLPFVKKPMEDMYLTTMEFFEGKWIIDDIQKFSLQ
ncbi:zinc ribbon domain-containing protein [Clostridium carnis]